MKSETEETSILTRQAQALAQVSGEVFQRERERDNNRNIKVYKNMKLQTS